MARVIFSAMLSGASGKIGDVVASTWKGIAYFRRRVIPSNPQSNGQMAQRYCLKTALTLWQSIKSWAKTPWDYSVTGYALSGYNKFMDECMTLLAPQMTEGADEEWPTWDQPAITVASPFNKKYAELDTVALGTPGADALPVTWVQRAGADETNMVLPLYRLDDEAAWTAGTATAETEQAYPFAGLEGSEGYELALVPYETVTNEYGLSSHLLGTTTA